MSRHPQHGLLHVSHMRQTASDEFCEVAVNQYDVVELCAGAGGQALGLEGAGLSHALAVEIDRDAAATLRANRDWPVARGDVRDRAVWDPAEYASVSLLAGGVPCPPFSMAGKQLGAVDERDLFMWTVRLAGRLKPRALMLENVRGLSMPRFAGYRQHVLDELTRYGYHAEWRLLNASDFGVPQLRPRFVLVAMQEDDFQHFHWPAPVRQTVTVGQALVGLMASGGWPYANEWAADASTVAPTIVGGSRKHGGADLGPTRSKAAWRTLGVDGTGIADRPPTHHDPHHAVRRPRLTLEMVQVLQGWGEGDWTFVGGKTSRYRQIGNAFPPPVAKALGEAIVAAFDRRTPKRDVSAPTTSPHAWLYRALRANDDYVTAVDLLRAAPRPHDVPALKAALAALNSDFVIHEVATPRGPAYRLGAFRGLVDHC